MKCRIEGVNMDRFAIMDENGNDIAYVERVRGHPEREPLTDAEFDVIGVWLSDHCDKLDIG